MNNDLEPKTKDFEIVTNTDTSEDTHIQNQRNFLDFITVDLVSNTTCVDLGHTFTYTIYIDNKSEITLSNVSVTQKLSNNLRLTDVMIDAINITNIDKYNKFITFYIDEIRPNEKKVIDIVVEVTSIENLKHLSSDVKIVSKYIDSNDNDAIITVNSPPLNIDIITPKLVLKKTALVIEAIVGEIVAFNITAENKGNVSLDNIIIRDILIPELKFLDSTIKVDGILAETESVLSGINIGSLNEGQTKQIIFKAEILSKPPLGTLTNTSVAQYQYTLSGEEKPREGSTISNENLLSIQTSTLDINKTCNLKELSLGDVITCEIELSNIGTLHAKNIFIREEINNSLELLDGEFSIDGQIINNINLTKGILIGNLNLGEKKLIIYKAKYVKSSDRTSLTNKTVVTFDYQQTAGLIFRGKEVTKNLVLDTTNSNFKHLAISEKLFKGLENPEIFEVENVLASVTTLDHHLVKTPSGISN
ncbi:MAG: hypothetical protein ACRC68_04695, partial [Clostridium sp.]